MWSFAEKDFFTRHGREHEESEAGCIQWVGMPDLSRESGEEFCGQVGRGLSATPDIRLDGAWLGPRKERDGAKKVAPFGIHVDGVVGDELDGLAEGEAFPVHGFDPGFDSMAKVGVVTGVEIWKDVVLAGEPGVKRSRRAIGRTDDVGNSDVVESASGKQIFDGARDAVERLAASGLKRRVNGR